MTSHEELEDSCKNQEPREKRRKGVRDPLEDVRVPKCVVDVVY